MNILDRTLATDELVARIHGIGPLLRENAAKADRERRVPDECVEALTSIGALKINTPKRFGGHEGGARMLLEAASTIGYYCTNAAWISVISNVSVMLPLRFPEAVIERLWAGGGPLRMASVIVTPGSIAVREGDGYRVSGEWPFASNIFHANWALGVVSIKETPDAEPELGYAILHKDQYTIKDTWYTIGMRGTGSNTFVAKDQFVPADQVVRAGVMLGPDLEASAEASFLQRLAPVSMFPTVIVSGPLGAARAALDLTIEAASRRPVTYSKYAPQNTSGAFAQGIGAASAKIDTAAMFLRRACDTIDVAARGIVPMSRDARAGIRNDIAHATKNLSEAMDDIAWLHGTATFADANPIGRLYRDVQTGVRHAMAAAPLGYEIGGAALLGVEPPTPLV